MHTDDRQSFTLHSLLARLAQGTSQQERVSASSACSISSCCLVCSGLHARYTDVFNVFLSFPFSGVDGVKLPVTLVVSWWRGSRGTMVVMETYRWWSWLLLWIQNPRVHSSMVRAADCRSAGPRFNSGWGSWFIFMKGSDNLMNHPAQRYNTMSPIRTVITTITRKSVNTNPLLSIFKFLILQFLNFFNFLNIV